MNNPRRLSLRARMLILLIGVTAIFLLIMGAVTTVVLTRRMSNAFNTDLVAAATHSPRTLADNASGYLAVLVSTRTREVVPLTTGQQTTELATALSPMTLAQFKAQFPSGPTAGPTWITLADGDT